MASSTIQRPDAPESKSDASASGPGVAARSVELSPERHADVAARAYELARRRGFAPGSEVEDWLQAEREIEAGPTRDTAPDTQR